VKKQKDIGLNFIVDKLTNSIENVVSGDSFHTSQLDVDFIGSQENLTKEEELALNQYFTKRREERSKSVKNIPKSKRKKVMA
jgi:hypothetical protein